MTSKLSYFIVALIAALTFSCQPAEEDNVYMFSYFMNGGKDGLHLAFSEDGYNWTALKNNESFLTPTAGDDKLMRDPCIVQGPDGTFHMVWTVSWNEKGIGYANSKDLINWSEQKFIPVMAHEDSALNCWAPEIFYDEPKDRFMIYWATTIPGRFVDSDTTGDGDYNHRMYYVLTKDFETFSDTELLYDQGFNVIDAVIKQEGDEYIMFLKNETKNPVEKNIRISRSPALTGGYSTASEKITQDWVEGPTVIKIGADWIVYFDKYREHQMGAVKSNDLVNWTDISDQVNFPVGTRHGTIFTVDRSVLTNIQKSLE